MNKILIVTQDNAAEVYKTAAPEVQKAIKDNFKLPVTERIKSFEDALAETGESEYGFKFRIQYDTLDEIAYKKMKVITKALNEGWEPNWDDSNERKWRSWFYLNSPGFRFRASLYVNAASDSAGGSRLCLKSEELCNYAAKQFMDIYKDLFN